MGLRDRPGLLLATGALVARNRQKKKQEQQRQQYQAQSAQQQHVIQAQNQALGTVEHSWHSRGVCVESTHCGLSHSNSDF